MLMIKNKKLLQQLLLIVLVVIGLSSCAPGDVTKLSRKYMKVPDFDQEHEHVHDESAHQNDDTLVGNSNDNTYGYSDVKHDKGLNVTVANVTKVQSGNSEHHKQVIFYKRMAKKMSIIVSPILLIIGGIGNPLCIMILLRKKKPNSTIIYFCLLAVFDILVLYTGLLRQYIKEITNIDIRDFSSANCKIHTFLTYTFMQISSYILVAVTVNRFMITYSLTGWCKKKTIVIVNREKKEPLKSVYWIFGIICLVVSLLNVHFLIYYDVHPEEQKQSEFVNDCRITETQNKAYYDFRITYYSNYHLIVYIFVPCVILFIMNLLIIKKIMKLSNNRLASSRSIRECRKREKKRTALTIMLIAVCLWFMVLKTPASVYLTFPVQEMSQPYFPFIYTLFMLVNYTNHAVNLILYILTSSSFRREFAEFFLPCKKHTAALDENNHNNHVDHRLVNNKDPDQDQDPDADPDDDEN